MANTKISELPLFTGNTSGSYLVMNNSGQTQTFKVTRESIIGASGTSGTSGTSGSSGAAGASGSSGSSGTSGSNGSSGVSGSSGTSGDSIFAVTGSVWNTTRNVGVTGSLNVLGNTTITGSLNVSGAAFSDVNINGRISVTTPNGSVTLGGNINPNFNLISGSVNVSIAPGNMYIDNYADRIELTSYSLTGNNTQIRTVDNTVTTRTIVELPCSSSWNGGLTKFKYPVEVTGSIKVTDLVNIKPLYYGTGSIYGNDFQSVPGTTGDIRIFVDDSGGYNFAFFTVSGSASWAVI